MLLVSTMEEGGHTCSKELGRSLEAEKGKDMDFLLELPEWTQPSLHFDLSSVKASFGLLTFRSVR